ncbi:MAG: sporulation transcriptional regulator SpoIIID [Candidatus Improbicoccus pseudotrichonymphae]|uniref:Sporulation transcriptional regulator SpoIIID n=1 Tax=Candidatus Improbicoccus pseudotrichonymphae TaxID=3033792 RepID=A0AA48I388_9FIRM|nr:MAG: sporulation transcriptional regulator SpoIIID [Candidatus Improbicoccus pseudotrichonymphae]
MKYSVKNRALELGEFIVKNKTTIRGAAKMFGISKSTVYKDVAQRLKKLNKEIYLDVKNILYINKSQRHIRGGIATKNKYLKKYQNSCISNICS